jgi:hypothetical protein
MTGYGWVVGEDKYSITHPTGVDYIDYIEFFDADGNITDTYFRKVTEIFPLDGWIGVSEIWW